MAATLRLAIHNSSLPLPQPLQHRDTSSPPPPSPSSLDFGAAELGEGADVGPNGAAGAAAQAATRSTFASDAPTSLYVLAAMPHVECVWNVKRSQRRVKVTLKGAVLAPINGGEVGNFLPESACFVLNRMPQQIEIPPISNARVRMGLRASKDAPVTTDLLQDQPCTHPLHSSSDGAPSSALSSHSAGISYIHPPQHNAPPWMWGEASKDVPSGTVWPPVGYSTQARCMSAAAACSSAHICIPSRLGRQMESIIEHYDKECMKMVILKHEETFRKQFHELQRLYEFRKYIY